MMSELSQRILALKPSKTLMINALLNDLKKKGEDVINLSAGEPDIQTPALAAEKAIEGIKNGFTRYTNVAGIDDLREKLAKLVSDEKLLDYSSKDIVVSTGAKHSIYNALMVLCNPNDEVIIPSPYWVSYPEQVKLADAVPVIAKTTEATNFKLTPEILEACISEKTKVLIINTPSNPTGAVYSDEELKGLAEILKKYPNIYIISDEIYDKLVYGCKFASILTSYPKLKDRVILINGFSKTYGMTGWRIGYTASTSRIAKAMSDFQGQVTSNATSISQLAAIGAMDSYDENVISVYGERRKYMYERLMKMPNIKCAEPMGAFYIFPNVSDFFGCSYKGEIINDVNSFSEILLREKKVGVVPGAEFGAEENIRLSYASSIDNLKKALDRIDEFTNEIVFPLDKK